MFIPKILKESKRDRYFKCRKELEQGFQYINTDNDIAVIDCRIYVRNTRSGSQLIAIVWINDQKGNRFSHGVGIAGGHGYYHRGSLAIEGALKEMGIKLDKAIGGLGYGACETAFASVMEALGYPSFIPKEYYA
jgi:hypothetical protein